MEQIEQEIAQDPDGNSIISPNDAVGKILGKKHSGRNICVNAQTEDRLVRVETRLNETLNVLKAYILVKEGKIPDELAPILDPPSPAQPTDASSQDNVECASI
ncbi:hypothetical protein CDL12_17598 [Handroanthus impetiginosus]|uniref:Uncharacterized protein n=1 Tax=Handroanthus impetiginosus TaxID=429701 RepID=A0A2G9GX37_9LAMI|nr:hypothetical protein CDL12_17598 [Handroanthus impetiginosus]